MSIRVARGVDYLEPGEASMRAGAARRGAGASMGAPLVIQHGDVRITHLGGMGAESSPLIATPAAILNAMKTVDSYIDGLNVEIVKQLGDAHPPWYTAFRKFRADWKAYLAANSGLAARLTGARWDEVKGWQARAEEWRKEVEAQPAPRPAAGQPAGSRIKIGIPKSRVTGEAPAPMLGGVSIFKLAVAGVLLFVAWPLVVPLLKGARGGAGALGARMSPRTASNPRRLRRARRR